jgi:lipoprotein-releasing system permease protein
MLGIMVSTMALIVVLSVFNGMEDLVRALFGSFDSDIKISATVGKTFRVDSTFINSIKAIDGIDIVSEIAEDNALLRYRDKQMVVKVKGVSTNYAAQTDINTYIVSGDFILKENRIPFAVLGRGIQYTTGVPVDEDLFPIQLWYPKVGKGIPTNPESAFNRKNIYPSGVFAIEKEYDDKYIFVPLDFALELFNFVKSRTALEIKLKKGVNPDKVKDKLLDLLGDTRFKIQTRDEQHANLIRAVKIEKLFVYVTFSLIIVIASFNIFYSLIMLVIDKRKDIAILQSLGLSKKNIRQLFMYEGAIISLSGAGLGLFFGYVICVLQLNYGLVSMGVESSLVDAYPVKIDWTDFVITGALMLVITFSISILPALRASKIEAKESVGKR